MNQYENYQVFISYRRDGGEDLAVLLEERLSRLGYRVFLDVESLRSGNFNEKLLESIEMCTDFLLVLPEHGLDRCIDNSDDWVRREISHALAHKKNIIPVMKRNFIFPENLPEDIRAVKDMHGVAASMDDFNSVISRIATKYLHSKPEDCDDELLKKRAASGDAEAMNELALRNEYGSETITPNTRTAMALYRQAVDRGSAAAMYNLGDVYERCSEDFSLLGDYDIEVDREKTSDSVANELLDAAFNLYQSAAVLCFAPAIYKVGNIYEKKKMTQKAYEQYNMAAQLDYAPACNAVGFYYQYGIGTEQNLQKAEELYKKAADAMYAPAIYNYAVFIQAKNPEGALNYLRRIAFGDHAMPEAAYALGRIYELTYNDLSNAMKCYRLAARAGIAEAREDLDRCRYLFD